MKAPRTLYVPAAGGTNLTRVAAFSPGFRVMNGRYGLAEPFLKTGSK